MPIIYLPKWVDVVIMLYNLSDKDRYYQRLYRKLKMNSSHVRAMIHHLERCCLIERVAQPKIRYIVLTKKGLVLAQLALRVKLLLNEAGIDE